MPELTVHDLTAFEQALARHPRVLLFKHSTRCPVSAAARSEYDAFRTAHADVPTLFVDVIADRAAARAIAEQCSIVHESPQAILFERGAPTWHASHDAITAAALEAAWFGRSC
jgi:bacillithiol system protein YtxJ